MDFPDDIIHIIIDKSSQHDQYRWLFVSKNWLKWISSKFIKVSYSCQQVEQFSQNNQWIDVINSCDRNYSLNNAWNHCLYGACKGGHLQLAYLMIQKGADGWNFGLYYACCGGHLSLVNLMIKNGATQCYNCGESIQEHLKK
jgi:hypothetical protein